ncbi:MAG: class I SAM-dependent methyltransferase [Polyangiales bacterium]
MHRIDRCPCCDGGWLDAYPAGVAPFIVERALGGVWSSSRLMVCRDCDFRFYETRYDDDEAARLYADYRGEQYFRLRHKHEPWYTRAFNEDLGRLGGVEARRAEIATWIATHRGARPIASVLDYGGDRGQFLPIDPKLDRFVFDISGVEPEPGVTAFSTREAIAGRTFDAIVLSQVLEHVSDVAGILDHVRALAAPTGAIVIVEVPDEHFDLRWLGRSARYQRHVDRVLSRQPFARAFDFYSAAVRVKLGMIPPLGFPRMHEHINYFEGRSLRAALEKRGLEVVVCEKHVTEAASHWLAIARTK